MWFHHLLVVLGAALVNGESPCIIGKQLAYCESMSLTQIPDLPSDVIEVYLALNYIRVLNENSFPRLEQLKVLDLGMQRTQSLSIGKHAFKNLMNLAVLHLGNNEHLVLHPDAFVGLFNLRQLILLRNNLSASILEAEFLRDLVSLEALDLRYNNIERLKPNMLFQKMTHFNFLDLNLNKIAKICEGDLYSFHGKNLIFLSIASNPLRAMKEYNFDWMTCGNPLRNVTIQTLDMSLNGFGTDETRNFFLATKGTRMSHIVYGPTVMGSSFGFSNSKDPNSETFLGLAESFVRSLDLSKGFIFSLNPFVFEPLKYIEDLILSNNKINQIKNNAFAGLQNLNKLNLSNNLLGEIYAYTFDFLGNVTEIDLANNHIGVIQSKSFRGLSNLFILNLRGNAIIALHVFAAIPNLQYVLLGDNRIQSTYGLEIFSDSSIFIDLSDNKLKSLSLFYDVMQFPNLQYLLLRHNKLSNCFQHSEIPKKNNLIHLDLEDNVLQVVWEAKTCLDMFDNLGKLVELKLNQNLLRFLPKDIFKGLISLQRLVLSSNLLAHLPTDVFPRSLKILDLSQNILLSPNPDTFSFIKFLDLGKNQYICDCHLQNFTLWISKTNVTFLSDFSDMYCSFPQHLIGIPLANITFDDCDEEDQRLVMKLKLSLFIGCTTTLIIIITSVITFTQFRGLCFIFYKKISNKLLAGPKQEAGRHGYKYDAYICFSNNDFKWVEAALLQQLDKQFSENNKFHLCFEARDFIPG